MILMKSAMPYLDIVRAARERVDVPIGTYHVSGEYSIEGCIRAAELAQPERTILESLNTNMVSVGILTAVSSN